MSPTKERSVVNPTDVSLNIGLVVSDLQVIVAIVVPAGVAVVSILSAQRLSRRALDHQRRISDLDAVRSLLDRGAELLRQTTELVIALDDGFEKYGHQMFAVPMMSDTYDALDRMADDLGTLSMRVDIRLGPSHPAGLALDLICGAVEQVRRTLRMARLGIAPTAERSAEDRKHMEGANKRYFLEVATYIVSAHQTVGAELPGVDLTILGEPEPPRRPTILRRLRWELVDVVGRLPLPASAVRRLEGSPF